MVPAHNTVFLFQKRTTENGIIQPAIILRVVNLEVHPKTPKIGSQLRCTRGEWHTLRVVCQLQPLQALPPSMTQVVRTDCQHHTKEYVTTPSIIRIHTSKSLAHEIFEMVLHF